MNGKGVFVCEGFGTLSVDNISVYFIVHIEVQVHINLLAPREKYARSS